MSNLTDTNCNTRSRADGAVATVGVVGGRGYVGRELIRLIGRHPRLDLAFASSDAGAGRPLADVAPESARSRRFISNDAASEASDSVDVLILALPNGAAGAFLKKINARPRRPRVILDISADHRFSDGWTYGLPETFTERIAAAERIANPGCYATAMHLALRPLVALGICSAHCFGVSGFSGAGAAPNDRNNADLLRDNILPYALTGHGHERETGHHLGAPVRFAPAVAPFFRGLMVTALVTMERPITKDELHERYQRHYAGAPFVRWLGAETPTLHAVANSPFADVGALSVDNDDPRRLAVVCALDNLMKGAASQAVQNLNLALGYPMTEGLLP